MLETILNWSEVWAPLTALLVFLAYKYKNLAGLQYLKMYLLAAIILNLAADIMWRYKSSMPESLQDNNFLYNIHSIIRTCLFILFFAANTTEKRYRSLYKLMIPVFLAFIIFNFIFLDSFLRFSSNIFTFEGLALLLVSLHTLWQVFTEESNTEYVKQPIFWIAAGVAIYEAASFFIFIFYASFRDSKTYFAERIWDVHNILYIVLCFFIAKAIHASSRQQY